MITNEGLRLMGFTPLPDGQSIAAALHLVRVYAIEGFSLKDPQAADCPIHSGVGYRVGVGTSVNAVSMAMIGDSLVEDEESWQKKERVSPPFLVLHVGPTAMTTVTEGFVQRKDGALITHDCFGEAKRELAHREALVIEPAVTALSIAFSDLPYPVELRACGRHVFGETDRGERVHDIKFTMSATATVSSPLPMRDLATRIQYAAALQEHLDPAIARFYYMGLSEDDPLKQFLYFFLFVEHHTHHVFKRVIVPDISNRFFNVPSRLSSSITAFAEEMKQSAKSLAPRFIWCALLAWTDLTDEDVDSFRQLKVARDRLTHGERTKVDKSLAVRARELSARILLCDVPRSARAGEQPT